MPYTCTTQLFTQMKNITARPFFGVMCFCLLYLFQATWAHAVYLVQDTHGPEYSSVGISKDFRGSVSHGRKNFPSARAQAQDKYSALVPSLAVHNPSPHDKADHGGLTNSVLVEKQRQAAFASVSPSDKYRVTFSAQLFDILPHAGIEGQETGLAAGSSYGSANTRPVALMPKYKDFLMYGITNNTIDSSYRSDLSGLSVVANIALDSALRVGLTLDIGIGHTAFVGDHYNTHNVYDYWGASLYAGYNFNNMGLLFDVGYRSEYSDMEQPQSASMLKGSVDSDTGNSTFTAGLRAEYRIETDLMTIAPHVGLRYTATNMDRHSLQNESAHPSAWTIPVGVSVSTDMEVFNGWTFVPSIDVGFVGTIGNLDATTSMPNTQNFNNFSMQAVDKFAFDGGVGLSLAKENLSFDVQYNIQLSQKKAGHLVSGMLRYAF